MSQVYGRTFRLSFRVTPDLPPVAAAVPPRPVPAAPAPAPGGPVGRSVPASNRVSTPAAPVAAPPVAAPAQERGTPANAEPGSGERLVEAAVELLGAQVTDIRQRPRPA